MAIESVLQYSIYCTSLESVTMVPLAVGQVGDGILVGVEVVVVEDELVVDTGGGVLLVATATTKLSSAASTKVPFCVLR